MAGDTYALVLLSAAKWLTDLGIVWLVGVCAFRVVADRVGASDVGPGELERRLTRHAGLALALLFVAVAARLYAQTYSSFGLEEPVTGDLLRLVAEQTRWGGRWIWQSAAVVVGAPAVAMVAARMRWGWQLLGAAAVAIVGTAPMTGHALAYSGGALIPMALQIGHLLAAGVWLGTLFVMLSAGLRSLRHGAGDGAAAVSRLVDRFSPVALTAAATLVGTGVWTAYLYVDEIPQLWETVYGRVLLLKTGLFGVTAGLGAYNWKRVRPLLGAAGGADQLRRSGTAELLVALTLLAVTAWLVHLPMPGE